MKLQSYVQGKWLGGLEAGVAMRDATTGDIIAEVSSAGIDFARSYSMRVTSVAPACAR